MNIFFRRDRPFHFTKVIHSEQIKRYRPEASEPTRPPPQLGETAGENSPSASGSSDSMAPSRAHSARGEGEIRVPRGKP